MITGATATAVFVALLLGLAVLAGLVALAALWRREKGHSRLLRLQVEAERQRAEAEGQRAEAEGQRAEAVTRAVDDFFNLVSHELRSPIAAIIGYQELLQDDAYGTLGDAASEPLERIGRSAGQLLHLVDGLLDLAQERGGCGKASIQDVDLGELMEHVASSFRINAAERSLRYSLHQDPDLPRIRSDPERLERALDLLVISALKYPAGKSVELRIDGQPDGALIHIKGTHMPVHDDVVDPALRAGVRMAIVDATARLLGCELLLDEADGCLRAASLSVRSAAGDHAAPPG